MRSCRFLLPLVLLCSGVLYAQSTAQCTYTLFKYPGAWTVYTAANGINNWGTIVGTAQDQTGSVFGFIRYAGGSFARYQVKGSWSTQFFHRNDQGATVGLYVDPNTGRKHGLLLAGNTLTTIDYPGAINTAATGINRWGTIVGYYTDATGHYKGFKRWSNGSFQTVSIPNYADIMPMDINDNGVIDGILGAGGPIHIHGFWLWESNWQILDDPDYPSGSTGLNGIGNGQSFVGTAYDSNGTGHAIWLLGNRYYYNLDVPNAVESSAGDIANSSVSNLIVGSANIPGGGTQAFIAKCQ